MFRICRRLSPSIFTLTASFFSNTSSPESAKPSPPPPPPSPPYQHLNCTGFQCLRESSILTLSSSSSFLKQTLYYYSESTQNYCIQLTTMIRLLEEYQRVQGSENHQQEIWNQFVEQRNLGTEMKNELLRLRLLLSTLDRLVNESIDACYQTQDETVTQLVSNELIQMKRLINQNEELINKTELLFTQIQVKIIEEKPNETTKK